VVDSRPCFRNDEYLAPVYPALHDAAHHMGLGKIASRGVDKAQSRPQRQGYIVRAAFDAATVVAVVGEAILRSEAD
jgi:hypothetical protein